MLSQKQLAQLWSYTNTNTTTQNPSIEKQFSELQIKDNDKTKNESNENLTKSKVIKN
jgi:hypothetical protein